MSKIVSCEIVGCGGEFPGIGHLARRVIATFDNGAVRPLFDYFPDEVSFSDSDFIGLTEEQARRLFHQKDIAYLRS